MDPLNGVWKNAVAITRAEYRCGHCGTHVGPSMGFPFNPQGSESARTAICPACNRPTLLVFSSDGEIADQVPGPLLGNQVEGVPNEVDSLYDDARKSLASGAFTSCVLTLRKILMHIAVDLEAKPGQNFATYVEHLTEKGYVPPGTRWVDYIRRRANEANHEIVLMDRDAAVKLLRFTENLLRHVYELPGLVEGTDEAAEREAVLADPDESNDDT